MLLVTPETLQINPKADIRVDAWKFESVTQPRGGLDATTERLVEALSSYRGEFLEGFSIADSARFDDWASSVRERLAREAVGAAEELTRAYAAQGDTELACESAWREVALERE